MPSALPGIQLGIYLDNAATSFPKPETVYRAVDHYLREVGASAGRGAYRLGLQADRLVYATRTALARLFNVPDASRIVFTANATEAINLALKGLLTPGDEVVTSSMEHNAVWRPLKRLERERGVKIKVIKCARDGSLDLKQVEEAVGKGTKMVVITHASNLTGTLMPVAEIASIAHSQGAIMMVDAAQTAGAYPIDIQAQGIDLLAFTGHKALFGPPGTGGLYIAPHLLPEPLKEGGTGAESLLEEQPPTLPERYEAGTPNTAGLAGLGAGVEFILQEGIEKIYQREKELLSRALEELATVPGITIYGPGDPGKQIGVVSFNLERIPADEVAYLLDSVYGIMVRTGMHCAPQAHRTIGTLETGAVRIGLGYFNTEDDLVALSQALKEISREMTR